MFQRQILNFNFSFIPLVIVDFGTCVKILEKLLCESIIIIEFSHYQVECCGHCVIIQLLSCISSYLVFKFHRVSLISNPNYYVICKTDDCHN